MRKITKAQSHKLQTSASHHSLLRTKAHSQCSFQPEEIIWQPWKTGQLLQKKSCHCKESALLSRRRHSTEPEKISPQCWLAKNVYWGLGIPNQQKHHLPQTVILISFIHCHWAMSEIIFTQSTFSKKIMFILYQLVNLGVSASKSWTSEVVSTQE